MTSPSRTVSEALSRARNQEDAISRARRQRCPDRRWVIEVLERLRAMVLDQTPTEKLESDLEVAHGLIAGLVGAEAAVRLLERLPAIRKAVATDVEAAYARDPSANAYAEVIAAYPSVEAMSTYRIAHEFYRLGHPVTSRIMSEYAHGNTGIDIHPGARIGSHCFIDHGTGVVIGETTIIGDRVKIYHGVTLGAFSNKAGRLDKDKKRHPTIEDDVTIYPNATVLGGETVVGRGSVVAGNAWLTESVDPFTRVLIEPPRLQVQAPDSYEI
ncbi:MAG: serine acetyltransferase [Deltaproteobacteria bacterium]|nr:MAG: serine acetyltransferase [Deltaproteobacteria bacterium]